MLWNYTLFIAPLIAVTGVSLWLAHRLLAYRPRAGAASLALFMIALAVWSVAYGLELGNSVLEIKAFWYKAKYIGIVAVLLASVYFVLQYVGHHRWANWRTLLAIGLVPTLALVALWTNSFHHLFLRQIALGAQRPVPMLHVEYGTLFWVFTAYYYLVFATSMVLLVHKCWMQSSKQMVRNVLALLVGASAPWLANFFTLSPWNPMPDLDFTPFTFTITGVAIAWALFRHQLLYMMPIAHGAIINNMKDGIVILNAQNQIVEMNPAAQRILHAQTAESDLFGLVGQPVEKSLSVWPNLITYLRGIGKEYNTVLTNDYEGERRYFDVHITPIYSLHDRLAGRLLVIHESTERERTAEALRQRKLQLRSMVEQMRQVDNEKSQIITALQTKLDAPLFSMRQSLTQLETNNHMLDIEQMSRLQQEMEIMEDLLQEIYRSPTMITGTKIDDCPHQPAEPPLQAVSGIADATLSTAQLARISGAHRFSPAS